MSVISDDLVSFRGGGVDEMVGIIWSPVEIVLIDLTKSGGEGACASWNDEGEWFGSFFWGWDQIENTLWD